MRDFESLGRAKKREDVFDVVWSHHETMKSRDRVAAMQRVAAAVPPVGLRRD